MRQRHRNAILADRVMTVVLYGVAGFFLLLLAAFTVYILGKGIMEFDSSLLAFNADGIGNQFFNTVYLVFLALLISVPIGVAAGIYMAEYAKKSRLTSFLRTCIETLSSLPSIVVGLFGYLVFVVAVHGKWSLMAGALAVSILSLPLITTTTEDALRAIPKTWKEGSFGLGATHRQTILRVMLPGCVPRIITGVILAAGRGFGEAAALLYTAGMSTDINWSRWWKLSSPVCPFNPFRPGETLALQIWASRTEAVAPNAAQVADVSAAALILMVFVFSIGARAVGHRLDRKMTGGRD
ncbi:phosphate ABC transporter permease PstA [Caproiciproducens sp. NJN-50]|uniref:phosphate ABC transporter permease PstA n=1 Tax=Acutalibacteraceae TaxID=3082771 RepID=UPI000FFE28BC|nr:MULTISPECIES: phosphate ABC transporter permease PstA [Acutalibacteraceae]QAT51089.1 phosphate ABC transporter permease PstA [Caproiciproducens sp. NJN-50]